MSLAKNDVIEIEISSLSSDGNGFGRFEGQAVFIPNTAQGDIVQAKVVKALKNHAFARVEKLLQKSPHRIESDCPVSSQCGGCAFRHIDYTAELEAKQSFVKDALERIGGLKDIPITPIIPSPVLTHYRNKVQYPVGVNKSNEAIYGFYAKNSHRIVEYSSCLLQPQIINEIIEYTIKLINKYNIPPYEEATRKGIIRHIYVRITGKDNCANNEKEIMLCLVCSKKNVKNIEKLKNDILDMFPQICTVILNINSKDTNVILGNENIILHGNGQINDMLKTVPLKIDVYSFNQVNSAAAELLLSTVYKFADVNANDDIFDMYCGAGVIGLSLAPHFKSLVGVDTTEQAIESAHQSAAAMGLSNARFICDDAGIAAENLSKEGYSPTTMLVDPPRKGCGQKTLDAMLKLKPKKIVMVSCNPATLARDLEYLTNNSYKVEKVQPVDMFPRTRHVECVVLMSIIDN